MPRPRLYKINEEYFNTIDSHEKAYILGFLYADGNVGTKNSCISIKLSTVDVEVLEFIKREIEYTGPIRHNLISNREYSTLAFNSSMMKQHLTSYGIVPNKTYESMVLPICPNEFLCSMLLGLFDGDGSIWRIKNEHGDVVEFAVNFSGNDSTLSEIRKILLNNDISTGTVRYRYGQNRRCSCSIDIKGSNNIAKLYSFLYSECKFNLSRKKLVFDEFNAHLLTITRNYCKEVNNKVTMMYNKGFSQAKISDLLQLPHSSVRSIIQRGRKNGSVLRNG